MDFAGPFLGSMYFVLVDSHSRWLEVEPMASTTTDKAVEILRSLFARFGCPKCLVSDNEPEFTAREFTDFLAANGVQKVLHITLLLMGLPKDSCKPSSRPFEQEGKTMEV